MAPMLGMLRGLGATRRCPICVNSMVHNPIITSRAPIASPWRSRRVAVVTSAAKSKKGGKKAGKGFGAPSEAESQAALPKCECGSGKPFQRCCEPALSGTTPPATPEAAIRARFTAFKLGNEAYVEQTTHRNYLTFHYEGMAIEEAKAQYAADIHEGCVNYDYADFTVVKVEAGDSVDEGFVAYSYKSSPKPKDGSSEMPEWKTTNEKALMLRVNGEWLFSEYQRFEYSMGSLVQGSLDRAEEEMTAARAATGAGSALPGMPAKGGLPQVPSPKLGRARAAITPAELLPTITPKSAAAPGAADSTASQEPASTTPAPPELQASKAASPVAHDLAEAPGSPAPATQASTTAPSADSEVASEQATATPGTAPGVQESQESTSVSMESDGGVIVIQPYD